MEKQILKFNIKAGKRTIELTLLADDYSWEIVDNDYAIVADGYYSYNKTEVVASRMQGKYELFEEELLEKVQKFAKKLKFIKK